MRFKFLPIPIILVLLASAPPQRYRISALECFDTPKWVLVSQFSNGEILMSWGLGDHPMQLDLPVHQLHQELHATYNGRVGETNVALTLDRLANDRNRGSAHFEVIDAKNKTGRFLLDWDKLTCTIFVEDE